MVTVTQAASDFNRWLARKHASSKISGIHYKINFRELPRLIDEFRMQNYPTVSATDLPEVSEIESAIRSAWGMKSRESRKTRAQVALRKKFEDEEAARQLRLL